MDLSWSAGQVSLTNTAAATAEAIAKVFPSLDPFGTYELAVAEQLGANANLEFRKDANNRFIVAFTRFGTIQSESFVAGTSQGAQVVSGTNLVPAAPYKIRVQMQGRSLLIWFVKNGVSTYVARQEILGFDFRSPAVAAGFETFIGSRATDLNAKVAFTDIRKCMSGNGHADPRVVSYEDGTPIQQGGYVWLLMTTRGAEIRDAYQGVYKYNPKTGDLQMTGAIFGNRGDGVWRNDNAGHLFYDRNAATWRLVMAGHSDHPNPRTLWGASLAQDIRNGLNIVSVAEIGMPNQPTTLWEDVYPIWDAALSKWVATASKDASISARLEAASFGGPYSEISTAGSQETGNLIVQAGGQRYVLAGTSTPAFIARAYSGLASLGNLTLSADTGGNRVWPVVFPYVDAGVTRLHLLSFDRSMVTTGSNYSYGALYRYFEGVVQLAGVVSGSGTVAGTMTGGGAAEQTNAQILAPLVTTTYRGSDAGNIQQASGVVSQWMSVEGTHPLTVGPSSTGPVWNQAGGYVEGDGLVSGSMLQSADGPFGSDLTIYAVIQRVTGTNDDSAYGSGGRALLTTQRVAGTEAATNANGKFWIAGRRPGADASQALMDVGSPGGGSSASISSATPLNTKLLLQGRAGSTFEERVGAGAVTSVAATYGTETRQGYFTLFGDRHSPGRRLAVRVYELVVVEGAPDSTQNTNIRNALAARHGITV